MSRERRIDVTDALQNHPDNGLVFFFVHPCNTADALREVIDTRQISSLDYMLLWLGLVGNHVGLDLPKNIILPV